MRNKEDLIPSNLCSRYLIPREEAHLFHVRQQKTVQIRGQTVVTEWIKCYRPTQWRLFEKIMAPGSKINIKAATGCSLFELCHDPRIEKRKAEVEKRKAEVEAKKKEVKQ